MNYQHLSTEERACIEEYLIRGLNISEIAKRLQRNKSTISRELRRNRNYKGEYRLIGASRKAAVRKRRERTRKLSRNIVAYKLVLDGLHRYWSPEEISNTLPKEHFVSTSTIYRAINKGLFPKAEKEKLRRYGKKVKRSDKRGVCYDFSEVRKIGDRPQCVFGREEFGHWELDTVVLWSGANGYLSTMVERKTRFLISVRLKDKKAATMADAIIAELGKLPFGAVKTLTVDRGLEFTDWKRVEEALSTKVYFCDPYKPYQRPTNENTNGLLRQFFPRRKPASAYPFSLSVATLFLNHRPRKCLSWSSPLSAFLLHLS